MKNNKHLKIGFINLMPDTQDYHEEMQNVLQCSDDNFQLHGLRLRSKAYKNVPAEFINEHYQFIDQVLPDMDCLILSGAPFETIPYTQVTFWQELSPFLKEALEQQLPVFAICWGALALGELYGINRELLSDKEFGVYNLQCDPQWSSALSEQCSVHLPFSIQARFDAQDVSRLTEQHQLRVIARQNSQIEHAILESHDGINLFSIAHPEYGKDRLFNEWQRDLAMDPHTPKPAGVEINNRSDSWRPFSVILFKYWLEKVRTQKSRKELSLVNNSTRISA